MSERPKIQFRLRDLVWAVSLIGASLGFGVAAWRYLGKAMPLDAALFVLFFLASGAFLGAGLGMLLHRAMIGAVFGAMVAGLLFLIVPGGVFLFGDFYDGLEREDGIDWYDGDIENFPPAPPRESE